MNRQYLSEAELPFCKGCGHALIAENTDKALQKLGLPLLDVIIVTDIGCHGIIDKCFKTHTFHGLHGRSVALASGVSAGLNNPDKKVIVFIGDGGATIGMQHLIDAAHHNFNLTVVLHNNFLYGMTGGQPSGFSPEGFKTPTLKDGAKEKGIDICHLITAAGANYVSRILGIGDYSDKLAEAYAKKGFSLVEVMEVCPSYAMKANPGMKLGKVVEDAGLEVKVFANHTRLPYDSNEKKVLKSLIETAKSVEKKFASTLKEPVRLMINGSAGEGVQLAAEYFATAGITAGLNVTKKGSYPVTVGIGFSSSDVILSPEKILFTGSPKPDVVIVTSADGFAYAQNAISKMDGGILFIDSSLPEIQCKARVFRYDYRNKLGTRNAVFSALFHYLKISGIFPTEALLEILQNSPMAAKTEVGKLVEF